jgi:hypothetical protein
MLFVALNIWGIVPFDKGVSLDPFCSMLLHLQIESKLTPLQDRTSRL